MSKNPKFVVTAIDTDRRSEAHTLGSIFRPDVWELRKILHIAADKYPDAVQIKYLMLQLDSVYTLEGDIINEVIAPYFGYALDFYKSLGSLDTTDKVCAWVIACYWYMVGGPKPASKIERSTHKKVHTQEEWKEHLFCPYCKEVTPKKVLATSDKVEGLRLFAEWIGKHSKVCEANPLSIRNRRLAKQLVQKRKVIEKSREVTRKVYEEALKEAPEVLAKVKSMDVQLTRAIRERDEAQKLLGIQDSNYFKSLVTKAEDAKKSGILPLNLSEQYRLRDLRMQIQRIEEVLNSIKGKRGYAKQRKSLQKDLDKRMAEFEPLSERHTIAGDSPI